MEHGRIERELFIDASPEIVFEVVSQPEYVSRWWPDEARYEVRPGATGEIVFGRPGTDRAAVALSVVEVEPPRRFSFRWTQPSGTTAVAGNSLLVTFELSAARGGTVLTMTETGFRELGWEAAVLEEQYLEHVSGWDFFLPRLEKLVAEVAAHA